MYSQASVLLWRASILSGISMSVCGSMVPYFKLLVACAFTNHTYPASLYTSHPGHSMSLPTLAQLPHVHQ